MDCSGFRLKLSFLTFLILCGCSNAEYEIPPLRCSTQLIGTTSYADLKALAKNGTILINNDLIIEGIVISSDVAGNFFNTLSIQESNSDSAEGIELKIDLRDSYLFYPTGTKIYLKLKGLYVNFRNGNCELGSAMNSFGSLYISRIPNPVIEKHLFIGCSELEEIHPKEIEIDSITDHDINTLVLFNDMEFSDEDLGMPYAAPKEETVRTLMDCNGASVKMIISGFSDFQSKLLPEGNGTVRGIINKRGGDYVIRIRHTKDISFDRERCNIQFPLVTSDSVFISEIADPDNDTGGRFIELFNSSREKISLKGWKLRRFINNSTEPSNSTDLTGYEIEGSKAFVISPDTMSFQSIYGFKPDLESGKNSVADSNGDDNLELVDPFGTVIDRFGIPGEDGSGTNHEFEDGGAFRRPEVFQASDEFNFEEWIIYNDTGAEGTIKQVLFAPGDFTPGQR